MKYFYGALITLLMSWPAKAQQPLLRLTTDSLAGKSKKVSVNNYLWLYHAGDNKTWADTTLNDSNWERVQTDFGSRKQLSGWHGTGWFRLWINAERALVGQPLALRMDHYGVSDVYFDGTFQVTIGSITKTDAAYTNEFVTFRLNDTKRHLIAVRFIEPNPVFPEYAGFYTEIGYYDRLHTDMQQSNNYYQYILIVAGILLALALLHLLLFVFYPRQKLNLYYSALLMILAAIDWADHTALAGSSGSVQRMAELIFREGKVLAVAVAWFLLYKGFHQSLPRWKILLLILLSGYFMLSYMLWPLVVSNAAFNCFFLLVFADELWLMYNAAKRGQQGVWLIGLGISIIALFFFFVGIDVLHIWTNRALVNLTMSAGFLSLQICYSIYLALDLARTHRELFAKHEQVNLLQWEKAALIDHQQKLAKDQNWFTGSTELTSMDTAFLDNVKAAVLARLADEQYSVERLAEDVGLSRAQLHRKLKGLVNQSPGDLIRVVRLQRAYELLKNNTGTEQRFAIRLALGTRKVFRQVFPGISVFRRAKPPAIKTPRSRLRCNKFTSNCNLRSYRFGYACLSLQGQININHAKSEIIDPYLICRRITGNR